MTDIQTSQSRRLSPRRLALLATTALGLAGGALLISPGPFPSIHSAYAQNAVRPVGFADIVERVKPAVISVRVRMERQQQQPNLNSDENPVPPGADMDQFLRRFGRPDGSNPNGAPMPRGRSYATGQGSGFFISPDGYAVTNNHVVDKASQVQVTTDDGKVHTAKVIGVDQRTDLALIKVEGGNFPYAKLSDKAPRIGDWVIAVGNPFGLGGTVTAGIVSARGRDIGSGPYDDYIQIDAPVNKGNSGGPTFDVEGNVIGVNTAIFSPSGGSVGIAFAIPSDTVKTVVAQLKDKGSVLRGWIGVQVQPITPELAQERGLKQTDGALVSEPSQDGPAAKAGIKSGDVIVSVNGAPVRDSRDLAKRIGNMSPGATVKLVVLSGGTEKNVSLTLGELPPMREASAEPLQRPDGRRFRDRDQDSQRGGGREDRGERRRGGDGPRADRFRDRDGRDALPDDGLRDDGPRADRFGGGEERFRGPRDGGGFGDRFAQRGDGQRGEQRFGQPGEERSARRGGGMPRLGLSLSPTENAEGVVIAAVEPNSLAAQIGFQTGDVIIDVGGKAVTSPQALRDAIREARGEGKSNVVLRVKSQQGVRTITLPLGRA